MIELSSALCTTSSNNIYERLVDVTSIDATSVSTTSADATSVNATSADVVNSNALEVSHR